MPKPIHRRLFIIGALTLFLELMLVRWVGTELRVFAFLQNTVLVICFLGMGMGCLTCAEDFGRLDLMKSFAALCVLLGPIAAFGLLARANQWLTAVMEQFDLFNMGSGLRAIDLAAGVGLAAAFAVMILLLQIFTQLGRALGREMRDAGEILSAYSWNVAGSLIGVWLYVLTCGQWAPPVLWCAAALALLVAYRDQRKPLPTRFEALAVAVILASSAFSSWQIGSARVVWSPYQKLTLYRNLTPDAAPGEGTILTNNYGYQAMFSEEKTVPAGLDPYGIKGMSQYDLPYLLRPGARSALLVGAGSGNDAAGALRHGVQDITAVDIDPAIVAIGRREHPSKPYDSPNVHVVIDDARAFMAQTNAQFDVIVFGLLDAHTGTAMANTRLDNYLYTRESLMRAKSLLADGGIVALTFVPVPFINNRIAETIRQVFGRKPIIALIPTSPYGWGGVMYIAGDIDAAAKRIAASGPLAQYLWRLRHANPVVISETDSVLTDDWPYLYLTGRRIPASYYILDILLLAALLARGRWRKELLGALGGWKREQWHFFFLGAAFLLLEVQNISKAAVVLGNTWSVNAVILSAVLIMILLANALQTILTDESVWLVYTPLLASCLGLYAFDLSTLASFPYAQRATLVGLLTCFPMLFGGIAFIRSFAVCANRERALGANLIGSLAGGLLQSITFLTGIKALLIVVALLYCAALICRPGCLSSKRLLA